MSHEVLGFPGNCPDCPATNRERKLKHAETCPIARQEEESMRSDMDWFDAHPGTDWFWRAPTAAEVQLLTFGEVDGPLLRVEGRVLVRRDLNARLRDFGRVKWWYLAGAG
jgi:hypothetical protein